MSFGYYIPVAGVQRDPIAVADVAVDLGAFNSATQMVRVVVEGPVRATYDGSTPTSEIGHLFYGGAQFDENPTTAASLQFVALYDSAVLHVTEMEWFEEEEGAEVDYPTMPFKTMLDAIIRGEGKNPESNSLTSTQLEDRAELLSDAVREAWTLWWPKLTYCEERTAIGKLISWADDDCARTIDRVKGVYRTDPQDDDSAVRVPHLISPKGVRVANDYETLWVVFMEAPPEFTAVEYDETTIYEAGNLVFDPVDGHCYRALVESEGKTPNESLTYWAMQPVPKFLKKYLKNAVLTELKSEKDGKFKYMGRADTELDRLILAEMDGQGQTDVSAVRVS